MFERVGTINFGMLPRFIVRSYYLRSCISKIKHLHDEIRYYHRPDPNIRVDKPILETF